MLPIDNPPADCAFVRGAQTVGCGSPEVVLLSVFAHRAVGGESRSQSRHALADPRNPGGGNTALASGIELRDNLPFERVIKHLRFAVIQSWISAMFQAVAERPAHIRSKSFGPPAIQFRIIEPAVDKHLHAAGSTCLPRPPRCVQPDIYPVYQVFGHAHVIVAEKDYTVPGFSSSDEAYPLLNQGLPSLIRRMGLAGKDELHRSLGIG